MDGLRGLAALAVVMQHLGIAQLGHYAVMLFFVISGYCIAAAAETSRQRGVSLGAFMLRRLRRIYPPYLFAIAFYVLTRAIKIALGGRNDLSRPVLDWVQNLTLTQWVSLPAHPVATAPENPKLLVTAFWSLNYEEQFYLVMAAALLLSARRRIPIAATVLALAAVGLVWNFVIPDGWITGIFVEYWPPFALGACTFYALCLCSRSWPRAAFLVFTIVLAGLCAVRVLLTNPGLAAPRAYVEVGMAATFALFLYLARPASAWVAGLQVWRPVAALGTISYSLYLVHQFNLTLVETVAGHLLSPAWQSCRLAVMLGLQVGLATVFWYLCERPFLNRPTVPRSASVGLPCTDTR